LLSCCLQASATTEIYTLSLHDALPICTVATVGGVEIPPVVRFVTGFETGARAQRSDVVTLHQYIPDFNDPDTGQTVAQGFINQRSEEHTSELQSRENLVCRLLLEKKKQ